MIVSDEKMAVIATYMNDEIREKVHNEIAPCTNELFLLKYHEAIEEKEEFEEMLYTEFNVQMVDVWYDNYLKECANDCDGIMNELQGTIVNSEILEILELTECVKAVEKLGFSGNHIGYYWYEVELVNGDTFTIYCKE